MSLVDYIKNINLIGLKKYSVNTTFLLFEKIIRLIAALFVGAYIARYLGPENYGLLGYAQSLILVLMPILAIAHDSIIVKLLVRDTKHENRTIWSSFLLRITGTVLLVISVNTIAAVTHTESQLRMLILAFSLASISEAFYALNSMFYAKVMTRYIFYSTFIALLISSIIKIILVHLQVSIEYFGWVYFLETLVISIFLIIFSFSRKFTIFPIRISRKTITNIAKSSIPLLLSGFFVALYTQMDKVILNKLTNNEISGNYYAAVAIVGTFYFIPLSIVNSLFPAILTSAKFNRKLFFRQVQSLYDIVIWLSIGTSIFLSLFSPFISRILYGGKYTDTPYLLSIYSFCGIFVSIGLVNSSVLVAEGLQKYILFSTALGAVISLVANVILVPLFGSLASVLVALLSGFVTTMLSMAVFGTTTRQYFFLQIKSLNIIHAVKRGLSLFKY